MLCPAVPSHTVQAARPGKVKSMRGDGSSRRVPSIIPRGRRRARGRLGFARAAIAVVVAVVLPGLLSLGPGQAPRAHAAPATCGAGGCTVTVEAHDFASGDPLANFNYIINLDNTKLPNDPLALNSESNSPIVREGNQNPAQVTLPDGRYLVSVRATDHKMWGAYFTLPGDAADDGTLTVRVDLTGQSDAHPLPLGRITTYVFEDNAWTNGAPDAEEALENGGTGMVGFRIELTEETESAVTVDYNNDP